MPGGIEHHPPELRVRLNLRQRCAQPERSLRRLVEIVDREPSTLRRSLLAFRPLAPWTSAGALDEIVEFARELRFDEVVVYKPTTDEERDVFEDAVARLPSLRAG